MRSSFVQLVAALTLAIASLACDKTDASHHTPAAPAMPAAWRVKADESFDQNQKEFLETEGRVKGKLKSLRVTIYEVNGKNVRLNTLVPTSSEEGDKIFRILANKKKPWSYLRKGELLYEFIGPNDAEKDIRTARELLSR